MKLFLSAGEPSGDLHGSNLIRSVLAKQPDARITALGGDKMRAAGADLLYPLANFAVMGFKNVVRELPTFFHIGNLAIRHIRTQKTRRGRDDRLPRLPPRTRETRPRLRCSNLLLRAAAKSGPGVRGACAPCESASRASSRPFRSRKNGIARGGVETQLHRPPVLR